MARTGPNTYDIAIFSYIVYDIACFVYDIVVLTYDMTYDIVYDVVYKNGKNQ